MALSVFLSHSLDPTEQTLAWRLQTLAAAHGIEIYVPQRGAGAPSQAAGLAVQRAINRSDCVLAIITAKANTNVQKELKYALAKKKLVIPIVESDFVHHPLVAQFPRVFTFSPGDNPGKVEGEIVEFLKERQITKEKQQAIGALAALTLGLLLLFSFSEK
jgi:nucleoside 2-deoxyribosyltransferase